MPDNLKEKFLAKLEEQYGPMEKNTSRFGNATFGKVAKDLCISASQFSKLLSGSATEGMYIRSIRNVERLIDASQLERERDQVSERIDQLSAQNKNIGSRVALFSLIAIVIGGSLVYIFYRNSLPQQAHQLNLGQHPLSLYFDQGFDADFDSPFLKESEIQDFCPCSAYEGTWSLANEYKLPLPGNRKPGVYYLAKSADVRMKCSKSDTLNVGKGRVLLAYEYLINEIWVDTELTPLSPKYFNKDSVEYTADFKSLQFEDNPQFRKAATIHSFFIDKFELYPDSIIRHGEPCGRFATDVDQEIVATFEIDLKHILENVLGDLTIADCDPAFNKFCDPNELREGESVINFSCLYTIKTENLGMGGGYPYRKGYRLESQSYSDNLTCSCDR